MKKLLSFLLSVVIIFGLFCLPYNIAFAAKPESLITDGSFEAAPIGKYFYWGLNNWYGNNFAADGANWMVGSVTDERAFSGGQSLKISSVRWWSFIKTVEVEKNTDYTYTFYAYLPEGANTDLEYAGIRYVAAATSSFYQSSSGFSETPFTMDYYDGYTGAKNPKANVYGKWTRIDFNFNSGSNSTVRLIVGFSALADGSNYVYIDDMSLYKTTDCKDYSANLFSNGNFNDTSDFLAGSYEFSFKNFKGFVNNESEPMSVINDSSLTSYKNNTSAISLKMNSGGNFIMWSKNTYALKENTTYKAEFLVKTSNLTRLKAYIYEPTYTNRLNALSFKESPLEGQNIYSYKYDAGEDTANSPYRKTRVARSDLSFTWKVNSTTLNSDGSSMVQTPLNSDPSSTYGGGGWITVSATFTTSSGNWSYSGTGSGANNLPYAANISIGLGSADQTQSGEILIGGMSLKEYRNYEENIASGIKYTGSSIGVRGVPCLTFNTQINKELLNQFYTSYTIEEVGALALKTKYLNGGTLSLDGKYTYGGKTRAPKSAILYNQSYSFPKDGNLRVVLSNIMSSDYNSEYSYRPYVVLSRGKEEILLYGDQHSASLADVSLYAINAKKANGNFVEHEETRNLIEERFLSLLSSNDLAVNNGNIINDEFFGMNWAVYHGTTYMDSSCGRKYTEAQAQKEFDRLVDSGITGVRTIFRSTWMHPINQTFSGWNFDTNNMNAFYKWALEMQKRDIDIIITAGWLLTWYAREEYTEALWYDETPYLHGDGEDYYGESDGVDFTGLTDNEIRLKKASLRYGEWVRQALEAFKERGINNVKYVLCFTEPSTQQVANQTAGTPANKLGKEAVEYVAMVTGLHEVLTKHGVRDTVKIIGPNQATGINGESIILMEYCLEQLKNTGAIDIYTAHSHPSTANLSYSDFYIPDAAWNYFEYVMKDYKDAINRQSYTGKFLFDEFTGGGPYDIPLESSYFGVQTIAGAINLMKNGADGICRWNIFDQLWPNSTSTSAEFQNGIHVTGMAPSFFVSEVPRNQYYAVSLFTKYIKGLTNVVDCGTYRLNDNIYYVTLTDNNGAITTAVVNTGHTPCYFNLKYANSLNNTIMYRHIFDGHSSTPTAAAILPKTDKILRVNTEIKDVVSPGSMIIYTTNSN